MFANVRTVLAEIMTELKIIYPHIYVKEENKMPYIYIYIIFTIASKIPGTIGSLHSTYLPTTSQLYFHCKAKVIKI